VPAAGPDAGQSGFRTDDALMAPRPTSSIVLPQTVPCGVRITLMA
jgi:hypothetical protein